MALTWNASQNASWVIFQLARITFDDVGLDVAVAEVPAVEVGGQLLDEVLERLGVGIGVDEHEPVPRADLDLGQARTVSAVTCGRSQWAGTSFRRAVEVPGEAVERAADLRAVAVVLLELAAAVEAGVGEGLDGVGRRPHDHVRPAGDVVDRVVADAGDVLLPAGELPHPRPQPLLLPLVPLPRDVVVDRDVGVAEEPRRLLAQDVRHLVGVGVEQLLVGQTGDRADPRSLGRPDRTWWSRGGLLHLIVRQAATMASALG